MFRCQLHKWRNCMGSTKRHTLMQILSLHKLIEWYKRTLCKYASLQLLLCLCWSLMRHVEAPVEALLPTLPGSSLQHRAKKHFSIFVLSVFPSWEPSFACSTSRIGCITSRVVIAVNIFSGVQVSQVLKQVNFSFCENAGTQRQRTCFIQGWAMHSNPMVEKNVSYNFIS